MSLSPPAPVSAEQVQALAELAGLPIAPEHLSGVIHNLGILMGQARLLHEVGLDPCVEPAAAYQP